jgi:hypothetical protein
MEFLDETLSGQVTKTRGGGGSPPLLVPRDP